MALHCCPEDWDGGWKESSEMPQQHDHPTSSVLLTQLPSLRHSLSHGGPLLAEWWGTCGTGEMGEEHRGAPDVCMTTSGNARTNRQKGGEAGRKAQDSGSSFPPLPDLTHGSGRLELPALPPSFLTFLRGPWSLRPGQEDEELPHHPGAPSLPSSQS